MEKSFSSLEQKILDRIQTDFPLSREPYRVIGEAVGCSAEEAHETVMGLRANGIIRRLGGIFVAGKLGYVSCLAAVRVEPAMIGEAASIAGAHPEVTHNYERDCRYNLWFTVVARTPERLEEILEDVRTCDGVHSVHALPAEKTFKIRVDFNFGEERDDD